MPSISLPNFITKFLSKSTPKQSQRPGLGARGALGHAEIAPTLGYAFYLEQEVSIFSDVVLKLKQEMFRRGFFWEPKFTLKCLDCDAEYDEDVEECDCGSRNLVEPDKNQINFFDNSDSSFIESANYNHQSLKEVLTDFEFNLNVGDNAYLLLPKAYEFDNQGEIISSSPKEILSVDPRDIKKIYTPDGFLGGRIWVCPRHRDERKGAPGYRCEICGAVLQDAIYETTHSATSGGASSTSKKYYLRDEVHHSSKYYPSILYGFPPILKILDTAMAYHYLEQRVRKFYERGRAPGIATFPTNNQNSLRAFWDETMARLEDDPYYIPIVGYDSAGKAAASFLKLMEDPNLDMLEVKKELRERMGSRFGVSLIFQGDTSTSGGLNNEGLQITVTNRAIEDGQAGYNNKDLPWLCQQFGITDYILQLNPNEEQDEMAEKDRLARDISNAKSMWEMGFDIEYKDGEFEFSGEAKPPSAGGDDAGFFPLGDPDRPSGEPELPDIDKGLLSKAFVDDALNAIKAGALYSKYKDVPKADIPIIHGIIENAFESQELSLKSMMDKIMEATGLDEDKARMIIRTESSAVSMRAREIGWERQEKAQGKVFKFKVVVKHDKRTAGISKRIENKVNAEGGAVTLDRMKEIYKEESQKPATDNPATTGMGSGWTGWKNFVGHPHERCTVVRVV
ncbi:MAG: hypothetical protein KAS66_07525 [Candidatus Omnitrophica bacterium]|nr:hypothetical protein [Candidatus Omnitrophota bacterium]